ncbi:MULTISPECIES: TIGR02678 family protein [unclassified Rhodococcus (in: high G+C Gram-positive bacteria)]|uniref:TIGR02678 family protein n=1 Tax=unclassified Rhodococcus (in: high G+C Gram-positive bacteria) TaxID=192944 RepID=UPI00163AB13B|nr:MULTISPECIES: TIGR02678 family protein [unclassified Rhodococcus (in: high G+C Gram-positive bacteria)]MBC2638338.1 TIGR02678 family protein [Rhodococcus sp. 3A]MBC2896921.1 TIGR02678 family protein [Rhodococcus sp. 4CII]
MKAREISPLALDSYQRAARVILSNHLVTQTYPDRIALPLLRRWATELRDDLMTLFGYRLEVTETTARLFTVSDRLDAGTPAKTATDRTFDRYRYAYLALALAALGRAGNQITLSELADHVAADAAQVDGVDLSTERASDRDAFVDAVGWLAARGAIALADGDAGGWAANPDAGEALYDIDRSVVIALFRPSRALQHLRSIRGLLAGADAVADDDTAESGSTRPVDVKETARRVRRALVERPVVYAADLDDRELVQLALPRTAADVELLTGLVAERREEGVAMIDTSGRLSDIRFPGTGTVAQVALLLAGEIADRVLDPDLPEPTRIPSPHNRVDHLIEQVDSAVPQSGIFDSLAGHDYAEPADPAPTERVFPVVEDEWITDTVRTLTDRFGRTFAAGWQADPDGLGRAALVLLERLRLTAAVPGGVLALPALARYRGVVVTIRDRTPEIDLFQSSANDSEEVTA